MLLVGPPGTGKTLIARACAGEAEVPFYSLSGSDFVEMYVGVGASRVRDLFDKAKKSAPCIIFIDEIDAVGRQRGAGLGGGHDEREQTLNQLLVEMDGFTANDGVIVIARPPTVQIFWTTRCCARAGLTVRSMWANLTCVAVRRFCGYTPATSQWRRISTLQPLQNRHLALPVLTLRIWSTKLPCWLHAATKRQLPSLRWKKQALRWLPGPRKKSRMVTEKERKLTAFHEGGHAVATYYAKTGDPVHKITIVPRGAAGGFTMSLPEEDTNYTTKSQMEDEIVILLGGRVAEKLVLDDISTGASSDLERATTIARAMVTPVRVFLTGWDRWSMAASRGETFLGRDFSQGARVFRDGRV